MPIRVYPNPEPVPAASQLAVLPFLAAVDGFLRAEAKEPGATPNVAPRNEFVRAKATFNSFADILTTMASNGAER